MSRSPHRRWESWSFSDSTFSHNHPMFSSSEVWLLQSVAGIQPHPAANGFDQVLIKPNPPSQLTHATGSFDTARGRITTSWSRADEQQPVTLKLTVPPNVKATVHMPVGAEYGVMEGGSVLEGGRREDGSLIFEVGSGDYEFLPYLL
jgi:alpha-L-rhamnosidase|eukprot:SAG25_NODE_293_length_10288_cov_2.565904_3_plen_147_part_00